MRRIGFRRPSPPIMVAFVALGGVLTDSAPDVLEGGIPTGWMATATLANGDDADVEAWAVCAGAP